MKNNKILKIFTTISIAFVLFLIPCLVSANKVTETIRTTKIEVSRQTIDYQSILDEFEDSELKTENSLTTFVGYKSINIDDLRELDLLSETDVVENTELNVKYDFSYDSIENVVKISAQLQDETGITYIDELYGVAFINEFGEIDAVMNVDSEGILLSEMRNSELLANCGWFSKIVKNVVKAAVVVTVAAAVVVTTAAVVVATAGVAAPALVAAGVGITSSAATTVGLTVGAAAGVLYASTIGMSALKAGTAISEVIADGVSQILDKTTGVVIALIISGVEYITTKFTESKINELTDGEYKFMVFVGVIPYITVSNFNQTTAVWGLRLGLNTYSLEASSYIAAKDAGNGLEPRFHSKHNIDKFGNEKYGIYFDHYHPYLNSVMYDAIGVEIHVGHAFFGLPGVIL